MSGYEWERDEADWARRDAERTNTIGQCYQHDHRPNSSGGGTCVCGDEVKADDL